MKKLLATLALGVFILPIGTVRMVSAGDAKVADADDTARNKRDRGDTLTPMDQGGSEGDRTITQQIRKAVVARDDLSTNAQNVKIITIDSVVTLRGPVKSTEEKTTIAALAAKTAGVKRVDNQIEVEHNR